MIGHSADIESVGGGTKRGLSVPCSLLATSCCGSAQYDLQFRIPMIYGFTIHEHLVVDLQSVFYWFTHGGPVGPTAAVTCCKTAPRRRR